MEVLKKHIITILCGLAVVFMALPLANVEVAVEFFGQAAGGSAKAVTGFSALKSSVFAYLLVLGPILLIAMNYIKQLEPHKGILAIAVPAVCLIALVIVVIQAKSFSVSASSAAGSMDVKLKLGIGAILAGLTYLGTIVAGAVIYHDFTLDKAGLDKLKEGTTGFINTAQEKVTTVVKDATHSLSAKQSGDGVKTTVVPSAESSVSAPAVPTEKTTPAAPAHRQKSANLNRADEVLALVEKLSKMKDAGVLTEEEFSEKKKQLLEEI